VLLHNESIYTYLENVKAARGEVCGTAHGTITGTLVECGPATVRGIGAGVTGARTEETVP
jgi:hypothetical protein